MAAASATNGLAFVAVVGAGSGLLNSPATGTNREGTLNVQATISVHGVPPNTVLYVRRAADLGLGAQQADGTCQRAAAGQFQPAPAVPGGPGATIETSPGGAGATHMEFSRNDLPEGTKFDAMYQLVDAAATIDLRTPCFTFTVK